MPRDTQLIKIANALGIDVNDFCETDYSVSDKEDMRIDEMGISEQVKELRRIAEEWEPDKGYTGQVALRPVTYVLRNVPEYGLMDGYCIIGF